MPTLQLKRATVAENDNYIGEPGEIVVLTDENYRAVVHDGTTSGGYPLALESELGGGGGTDDLSTLIDDFEDGDTTVAASGWSGWTVADGTGSVGVDSSTPINGSHSGTVTANSDRTRVAATRDSSYQPTALRMKMRVESDTGGTGDFAALRVRDSTASLIIRIVRFDGESTWKVFESGSETDTGISADIGTAYTHELTNIDFSADTFDLAINGTDAGTFTFRNSASDLQEVRVISDAQTAGTNRVVTFDDVSTE